MLAPGPGHSGKDRSLSIKLSPKSPDGFVVHSFAGDDPLVCKDYVRERLGLQKLQPAPRHRAGHGEIEAFMASVIASQRKDAPPRQLVATYDYTDKDGTLLYQVLKYQNADGGKTFRQRRPDGKGGWIWQLDDRRVLYRLPELLKYPNGTVFFCEGEKDADRLAGLKLCATTVASGKWTQVCADALKGRDVVILQDSDEAGRKRALEAAKQLHGKASTLRVVLLPDLPPGGDVSDWLDTDPRRAEKFSEVCFDTPEWVPPSDATTTTPDKAEAPTASLPVIDVLQLEGRQVPERQWVVPNRIPARNVTLLSGDGGVGKSILTLQLAMAVRLGRDWLGALVTEPGHALVLCAEDDKDELHRRLALIAAHYLVTFAQLGGFYILPMAGQDALMAVPNRAGVIEPTKLYGQFVASACDIKPSLIVIDNAADVYAGNENDRAQVRGFIGLMRQMAITANAAVVLTSHPSLAGMSTQTGLSGSTAWNASVRSRMYLRRPKNVEDDRDTDLRTLEIMKSNYGRVGETINCRWEKGLFVPVASSSPIEKAAAEQADDHLFVKLLARFNEQGRNVSPIQARHMRPQCSLANRTLTAPNRRRSRPPCVGCSPPISFTLPLRGHHRASEPG